MERKKHNLLDHPIAGGFILTFLGLLFMQLTGGVDVIIESMRFNTGLTSIISSVSTILLAIGFWFIYRNMFKNQLNTNSKWENIKKGIILLAIPTIIFAGINLSDSFNGSPINPLAALFLGLCPGVMEEILFRGLFISNAMRTARKYKTILIVLIVTAINFGLFHFTNLLMGAGFGTTLTQVVYAAGLGMVFGAVYLRTGSLLPSIIAHTIIDVTAFLQTSLQATNGVMTGDAISWEFIVLGIAFMALGIYLIRPSKQDEILAVWKRKWNLTPPVLPQFA